MLFQANRYKLHHQDYYATKTNIVCLLSKQKRHPPGDKECGNWPKGNGPLEETPNRCWALYFNPFVVFNIKTGYPIIGDASSIHIVIKRDVCGRKSSKIRAGKNWEY